MTEHTELSIYDPESGTVWQIKTLPLTEIPESIDSSAIGLVGRLEVTDYSEGVGELGCGRFITHISAILLPPSSITIQDTNAMLSKVLARKPSQ
jgi:hypothetical protein